MQTFPARLSKLSLIIRTLFVLLRNSKNIVRCQPFLYVFHKSTTAKFDQSMVPATTLLVALLLIIVVPHVHCENIVR